MLVPIIDYEARISGRFDCPTPASASPDQKRHHVLPPVHDVRRPHCKLDLIMGTRGVQSERTDWCLYQGHCPDSPVILGADRTQTYAKAARETGLSLKRGAAMAAALAVGAVVGAAAISGVLGVAASIHYLHGSWLFAASCREWAVAACLTGCAGAFMAAISDWQDWSAAHRRFAALRDASAAATRVRSNAMLPADDAFTTKFVREGLASQDWALQQAALEMEAARGVIGNWPPAPASAADLKAAQAVIDEHAARFKAA